MVILLLTDRERLTSLFADKAVIPEAKIIVVSTAEGALEAIASSPPDFIFIQERIGEVSGEVLINRLATELRPKKARMALMVDSPSSALAEAKQQRLLIEDSMTDAAIIEVFRRTFSSAKKVNRKGRRTGEKAGSEGREISGPLPAGEVSDMVALGGTAPLRERQVDTSARLSPPDSAPPARSSFQEQLDHAIQAPLPDPPVAGIPPAGLPHGTYGSAAGGVRTACGKPSLRSRILAPAAGSRKTAVGVAAIAFAALLIFLAVFLPGKRLPVGNSLEKEGWGKRGSAGIPSEKPSSGLKTLPSFIPGNARDAGYGATHPGWELYLTPAAEFRVYREQDLILSIQVIDRGRDGIASGLFDSALREIAGSGSYLVESRERQGPYLIEKGRMQNGAGIIVYRREPRNSLRAFVIDLRS